MEQNISYVPKESHLWVMTLNTKGSSRKSLINASAAEEVSNNDHIRLPLTPPLSYKYLPRAGTVWCSVASHLIFLFHLAQASSSSLIWSFCPINLLKWYIWVRIKRLQERNEDTNKGDVSQLIFFVKLCFETLEAW